MRLDRYVDRILEKVRSRDGNKATSPVIPFLQQSDDFLTKSKSFYHPLDTSKRETRLLRLLPGSRNESICIELSKCSLDDEPEYLAVSYTWESFENPLTVSLNGLVYNVTQNQHAALRYLRDPVAARTLWMDVFCIHQASTDDKAQQVAFMGEIYRNAVRTIVWLGDPETFLAGFWTKKRLQQLEDEVVKPFESLGSYNDFKDVKVPSKILEDDPSPLQEVRNAVKILQVVGKTVNHVPALINFPFWTRTGDKIVLSQTWIRAMTVAIELFNRPWWQRVWTLQEAVLSREPPTVLIGSIEVALTFFYQAAYNILGPSGASYSGPPLKSGDHMTDSQTTVLGALVWPQVFQSLYFGPQQRMQISDKFKNSNGLKFYQIIEEATITTTNRATLAHDCVFGLLGMCNDNMTSGIQVDYTAPIPKVFASATRSYILQARSLRCLENGDGLDSPLRLPSWVRDWTTSERDLNEKRGIWNEVAGHDEFTDDNLAAHISYDEQNCILSLPAKIIDTIRGHPRWSGRCHDQLSRPKALLKTIRQWFNYLDAQNSSLEAADIWRIMFKNHPFIRSSMVQNGDYPALQRWVTGLMKDATNRYDPIATDNLRYSFRQGVSLSRPFVTQSKKLGAGLHTLTRGDVIAYFPTCRKPFVLRPVGSREVNGKLGAERTRRKFRLVGACYLDGAMPQPENFSLDDKRVENIELH